MNRADGWRGDQLREASVSSMMSRGIRHELVGDSRSAPAFRIVVFLGMNLHDEHCFNYSIDVFVASPRCTGPAPVKEAAVLVTTGWIGVILLFSWSSSPALRLELKLICTILAPKKKNEIYELSST